MPDLTKEPYFDTTKSERTKGYQRVLGVPEKYIQARELTVLQGMVQDQLKDIADTLYKNGSVIEGCQIILDGNNVKITAGKIYYNGFIVPSPETDLVITGSGEETIGVKITETIITEDIDSSLRGQVPGSEAYGQPGAHRLKVEASVVIGEDAQLNLYKLVNGVPQIVTARPEMSELYNILARRTYDESENYLVDGLDVYAHPFDENQVELTIDAGKCYVLGYEITKPYPTRILRDKCTATKSAIDSYHTVIGGVTNYPFGFQPLAQITHIKGNVEVIGGTFYRSANPYDDLNIPNLVQITRVYLPDESIIYVEGSDYSKSGDVITWLGSGPNTPPALGVQYCVDYVDRRTLVADVDYEVVNIDGTDYLRLLDTETTQGLVIGTQMEFSYTYYLARKDIVYINKEGDILIVEGPPNDRDRVPTPQVPNNVLARAEIYMAPNSTDVDVENYDVRRLSMPDLHRVVKRLENVEYNLAVKDLDNPNLYRISPTELQTMFTDGFVGFLRGDLNHSEWHGGIDTINHVFGCPYRAINYLDFDVESATAVLKGDFYYLPYTDEVFITQPLASGIHSINPYSVYERIGMLSIEPPIKNYVENLIIKESNQIITVEQTNIIRFPLSLGLLVSGSLPATENKITSTWFKDSLLRNEVMEFIPETTITARGVNFYPNLDNLAVYFDGTKLPATPIEGTLPGTISGTVKSKSDGTFSLTFVVPADTFRTGTRKVEIGNENQIAETSFIGNGTKKLYERIYYTEVTKTTTTTPFLMLLSQIFPIHKEPLAQTFYCAEKGYLTKLDLYFKAKDTGNIPAFVQIRNVENGYPGKEVYTHKLIYPNEINLSDDGSAKTTITFDSPVYVEADNEYCFVIGSDSDNYEIFIADMGETDLLTNAAISRQPYFFGTMFSSANGTAWTVHQMSDIKFTLYRAKFSTTPATIITNNEDIDYTQFVLGVEERLPEGTNISWLFSQDEGTTWIPFSIVDNVASPIEGTNIKIKAVFNTTNPYLSPCLFKYIQGIMFDHDDHGTYISKLTTVPETFNKLKCYLDVYTPLSSGQSAILKISLDQGETWTTLTPDTITPKAYGWQTNYYEEGFTTTPLPDSILFRVDLSTNNRVQQPLITNLVGIMLTV